MTTDPTDLAALQQLAAQVSTILRDHPADNPTWTALESAWETYLDTGAAFPAYSQPAEPDPLADVAGVIAETTGPGQDGDQPTTCPACHHPATRHTDGSITCHNPDDGPYTMDRETLARIAAVEQAVADLAGGRDRGEVLASLAQHWPAAPDPDPVATQPDPAHRHDWTRADHLPVMTRLAICAAAMAAGTAAAAHPAPPVQLVGLLVGIGGLIVATEATATRLTWRWVR